MEMSFTTKGTTDMTTTEPAKPAAVPGKGETKAKPVIAVEQAEPRLGQDKAEVVTLDQLARELKMPPRDARMLLRLAAKQTKLYPNLGKEHVARQPWSWMIGSKALEEARNALSAAPAA
jgi:hypothetical protein